MGGDGREGGLGDGNLGNVPFLSVQVPCTLVFDLVDVVVVAVSPDEAGNRR